jgi:hypothetical protein
MILDTGEDEMWFSSGRDFDYHIKKGKLRYRILPRKPKTRFKCKTITNPVELQKMGYTVSKKLNPVNDYEIDKTIKKVA